MDAEGSPDEDGAGVARAVQDDSDDDSDDEPIGPLSLYFPDALVRHVMGRELEPKPSFIEAEQALLFSDGNVSRAMRQITAMRKQKSARNGGGPGASAFGKGSAPSGRSGLFGRGAAEDAEMAKLLRGAPGLGCSVDSTSRWPTHQQTSRWMTTIAGNAILVMVFGSILVVALMDGVITIPDSVQELVKEVVQARMPNKDKDDL